MSFLKEKSCCEKMQTKVKKDKNRCFIRYNIKG